MGHEAVCSYTPLGMVCLQCQNLFGNPFSPFVSEQEHSYVNVLLYTQPPVDKESHMLGGHDEGELEPSSSKKSLPWQHAEMS